MMSMVHYAHSDYQILHKTEQRLRGGVLKCDLSQDKSMKTFDK